MRDHHRREHDSATILHPGLRPDSSRRWPGAPRRLARALLAFSLLAFPLEAQDERFLEPEGSGHIFGVELKAGYRDSDEARFPVNIPFGDLGLDVDSRQALETVEPGDHFEVSVATVFYQGAWGKEERWGAKAKVDLIDRHDRNPTSTDREWDVDELWLRLGEEVEPGFTHEGLSAYLKVGKFPKFERQDDRHLESYGLISTSFNRMEDVGLEVGFDLGRFFYLKASFTQGNPVFYRDPNALAGDHGTDVLEGNRLAIPAELKTGVPILYDADVDDLDFENPEVGLGLGLRLGNEIGWTLDLLAFGYERDLADTVDLHGTIYGGDLDLLRGPANAIPLVPIEGREKEELGLTFWLYAGPFTAFGQYVTQDLAGLERDGFEIELSYDFELPYLGALFGRQVLPWIAPAARYSEIDPDFTGPGFPAPSVFWDWEKLDIGVRLGLLQGMLDMTVEYASNDFVRAGKTESADELLAMFRFMWDSSSVATAF
ncbi:MAG: hypothetical protein MI919_15715 [Holophagales bacterium]|nr:hypothetical protein [Holophagales bacterium]